MTDFTNISHADWSHALDMGLKSASTFRRQSDLVIRGAAVLFWANSKNVAYLNSALEYATAYRGIRVEAAKAFLSNFTGAKYDRETGKFVKGGKMKALDVSIYTLDHWVDWANEKRPEPKFDAMKDEQAILKTLERKLDAARDALAAVRTVEPGDEVDELAEAMLLKHIDKTEGLYAAAQTLYN